MSAISLGQAAHRDRLSRRAITKVGRVSSNSDGYLIGRPQLRGHFEVGNITTRPQECAGGFVDFLLGRGARHSRWLPRSRPDVGLRIGSISRQLLRSQQCSL